MASPSETDYFVHESAYVDQPSRIGKGTKVWHFAHILKDCDIGAGCSIGQNVMIGPDVKVGDGCKIQNNVALYNGVELEEGVFCGPSGPMPRLSAAMSWANIASSLPGPWSRPMCRPMR